MKRVFRSTDRRLVGAAVVSGLLLVPLGVFGSSALAHTASGLGPSAAQYQYKVTICHHTGSKKHPWHAIRISNRAVAAHLVRHGDFVVTPTAPCPPATTASPKQHGHSASHASSNSQNAQGKDGNSGGHGNSGHGNSGHDNGHHGKS